MIWYYKDGNKKIGPVTDAEFESLLNEGLITVDTPVWNDVAGQWRHYGEIAPNHVNKGLNAARKRTEFRDQNDGNVLERSTGSEALIRCSQCGNAFAPDDLLHYNSRAICAACKPTFFQRLREGIPVPGEFIYGGFWIRAGAKVIDWVILAITNMILWLPVAFFMRTSGPARMIAWVITAFEYALPVAYNTYFVGSRGATPGKMVCGLEIIRPDGGRVGYGRAFGRYFAEILSAITLMMGYIAVAFSGEKKALHDVICDTRVIRR